MATGNVTLNSSSYTIGATGSNYWATSPSYYTTSSIYANTNAYSNDIILRREGKPDIHVGEMFDTIMERLCLIQPAFDMIDKYPALKEAYENYKIVEAMVKHDWENNDGI
jgi:hypothetical protein